MPQTSNINQNIPPRRTQPPRQSTRILKSFLKILLVTTALLGGSMVVALISRACDNNQETSAQVDHEQDSSPAPVDASPIPTDASPVPVDSDPDQGSLASLDQLRARKSPSSPIQPIITSVTINPKVITVGGKGTITIRTRGGNRRTPLDLDGNCVYTFTPPTPINNPFPRTWPPELPQISFGGLTHVTKKNYTRFSAPIHVKGQHGGGLISCQAKITYDRAKMSKHFKIWPAQTRPAKSSSLK